MTQNEKEIINFFHNHSDMSISIDVLAQNLRVSSEDIVESLNNLQQADMIEMITHEYGRITEKGIEQAKQLSGKV